MAISAQPATAETIDPPERYLATGQAVDRGLDAAEAEIDRIETERQGLQCPAR
jgi:hypothetical protein